MPLFPIDKWNRDDSISNISRLKASMVKKYITTIKSQYPDHLELIDSMITKKTPLNLVRCRDRVQMLAHTNGKILFWSHYETFWYPTMRVLHKYPSMVPKCVVHSGACRAVMGGADVMGPGVHALADIPHNAAIAVYGHGKQHAMAMGVVVKTCADLVEDPSDVCVKVLHTILDGFWGLKDKL
eukprot:gnl/Dysnectes_brevis/996_a1111_3947.p1 GENE.gnl/Dysnectes_brevis/996_a1111_3947~~gnl/Dysnectes_brevis/996_a1111_3947.p1  ORF type:complete len:183 (-),score=30.32 gnl/Dysnectes_brevis/996_a1111_3947:70-618(-)